MGAAALPALDPQAAIRGLGETLGLGLSEGQITHLLAYLALLQKWNGHYNLTALRATESMLSHHLADCLAVVPALRRHLAQAPTAGAEEAATRVLDVGSGGGLPGAVLAILQPELQVTCVDTVGKKAAFIRQVAAELRLPNLRAEHARVEQLRGRYGMITSRAFASLADFVGLTRDLLAPGGTWMAMKGREPVDELAALPAGVAVERVEPISVPGLDAQRCLVWMTLGS